MLNIFRIRIKQLKTLLLILVFIGIILYTRNKTNSPANQNDSEQSDQAYPQSTLLTNWRNVPVAHQRFRNSWGKSRKSFWTSISPTVKCKHEHLKQMVSNSNSGTGKDWGKWTCGVRRLGSRKDKQCFAFSYTARGVSNFESSLISATHCHVYTYNPVISIKDIPLSGLNVNKNNIKISSEVGKSLNIGKSVKELMAEYGYGWIDILRVDIEGHEQEIIARLLDDFQEIPVGQLLVEFHIGKDKTKKSNKFDSSILPILEGLESKGMQLFYTELNPTAPEYICEFSFINTNVYDDLLE